MTHEQQDLAHLRPHDQHDDEIDLGELLRKLIDQWPLIVGITFLGAILGVAAALIIPKEYRVEAIFDKPSKNQLEALLSQELVELDRQIILAEFLKNLKSNNLLEEALETNNLLVDEQGNELTQEERLTKIQNTSSTIRIAPAEYDFIDVIEDSPQEFDQISFSALSSDRTGTEAWMNTLLELANNQTIQELKNDIDGQRAIEITKLDTRLDQLLATAKAKRENEIVELTTALAVAESLDIENPTSWEALIHGAGNIQQIYTKQDGNNDLFLQGYRFLQAKLASLKSAPVLEQPIVQIISDQKMPSNSEQVIVDPVFLKGQLQQIQAYSIDVSDVTIIPTSVKAVVPANAEKPNRKLIAVAATVLAGFLSLFIALIRIAIKKH